MAVLLGRVDWTLVGTWVLVGIGVVGSILTVMGLTRHTHSKLVRQSQKSGNNSTNLQSGGDITVRFDQNDDAQ